MPPRGTWSTCMQLSPVMDDGVVEPRYRCGQPVERAEPQERLQRWRRTVPAVETDFTPLQFVVRRSADDLGALRIFDPDYPERAVVAAGAPWFMTLFGRDSLITSWMALLVDPDLALGRVADAWLASRAPRSTRSPKRSRDGSSTRCASARRRLSRWAAAASYYGTADATPLFVMLLGELRRWGLAREAVDALLPAADRAMEWIERLRRPRRRWLRRVPAHARPRSAPTRAGRTRGTASASPTAVSADRRSRCARCRPTSTAPTWPAPTSPTRSSDDATRSQLSGQGPRSARSAFNRDFWLEEHGLVRHGARRRQAPLDALASNIGHCLWTGIVDRGQGAARREAAALAPRCSADGACARWHSRWPATTRSATTTARSGPTTTP